MNNQPKTPCERADAIEILEAVQVERKLLKSEVNHLKEIIATGQAAHNEDRVRADTLGRERDRLRTLARELVRALEQDCEIFRHYSELHAAKNTEIAKKKAEANGEYAATIRRLLARPEVKELLEGEV